MRFAPILLSLVGCVYIDDATHADRVDVEDPQGCVSTTWYLDVDGDGVGDDARTTDACAAPSGHVAVGGDCDDTRADVYPGAPEVCDGVDNSCNGHIDDADPALDLATATAWYPDVDGDGFGDAAAEAVLQCVAPAGGWVSIAGDCDDTRADIHPDAIEVCDEVDNNCSGYVDDEDPALDLATAIAWYPDGDGDGFGDESAAPVLQCVAPDETWLQDATDCDDTRADVYPGAPEVCDGVDNSCNGYVDDEDPAVDLTTTQTWYPDADGDGFGDASSPGSFQCQPPAADWVTNGVDCDDTRAQVYPGAPEICDGLDNNCTYLVDDDDPLLVLSTATSWWPDADEDGYGDIDASEVVRCEPPSDGQTWASLGGDCDDTRAFVNPGALEICGNAIDDTCSGAPDADCDLDLTAVRFTAGPDATGASVGVARGGDDPTHLLFGAPTADCSANLDCGAAFSLTGGFDADVALNSFGTQYIGSNEGDHAGAVVLGTYTDLEGPQLLIGAPGHPDGIVYRVLLGAAGNQLLSNAGSYARRWTGLGGDFGSALAVVKMSTGPDPIELAVGAPRSNATGGDSGAVWMIGMSSPIENVAYSGTVQIAGAPGFRFGTSLAAGDLFDEGQDVLIVGAPSWSGHVGAPDGKVFVFRSGLRSDGGQVPFTDAVLELSGVGSPGSECGATVAVADVDCDGVADLLVGCPGWDNGRGRVVALTGLAAHAGASSVALTTADTDWVIEGGAYGDALGSSIAGLGDTDGDGCEDIAIGAPGMNFLGRAEAGAMVFVPGSPAPWPSTLPTAYGIHGGPSAGSRVGASVVGTGDVNGDGVPDILVGVGGFIPTVGYLVSFPY